MSLMVDEAGITALLAESDVRVIYKTGKDFVCLCPFHSNRSTPSMTVSRETGVFMCFNPACGAKGDLISLVGRTRNIPRTDAFRVVEKAEVTLDEVVKRLEFDITKTDDLNLFPQETIDRMKAAMPNSKGEAYMLNRGFTKDTLDYFDIGYSQRQDCVTVPVHSYTGLPMGFIGRKTEGKQFLNSSGLQGRKTLFNVHRAKRHGSALIIVEASFDAMKVHQAGYPNVGALFKGTVTDEQASIIARSFSEIIIFVDNDDPMRYTCELLKKPKASWCRGGCPGHPPGEALSKMIYNRFKTTSSVYKVPFSAYSGLKDATDMTSDQITNALASTTLYGLDF
jgi:DNA primase